MLTSVPHITVRYVLVVRFGAAGIQSNFRLFSVFVYNYSDGTDGKLLISSRKEGREIM